MSFPDYVPRDVQQYITALLYGSDGARGWANAPDEPGNEWIAEIVAFLKRFEKRDETLNEMFGFLNTAQLSEGDQKQFVKSAWASLTDYKKYRKTVKEAAKLNQEIAIKADELARLLDQMQGRLLSDLPMEFYDVRTLLRETDNRNDVTWWGMNRRNLIGEPYARENMPLATIPPELKASSVPEPDPAAQVREAISYAWGLAPSLSELLNTVSVAASNYEPKFYGSIGAAVGNRQHSPKTEYLRAFGHKLTEARIVQSPAVMNAMARMATVALIDTDTDVSYDDVRKSLERLG